MSGGPGAQFTCCTGTKVQTLTSEQLRVTSTKVQILTPEELRARRRCFQCFSQISQSFQKKKKKRGKKKAAGKCRGLGCLRARSSVTASAVGRPAGLLDLISLVLGRSVRFD